MRYPWVCLSIAGVWIATLVLVSFKIIDPTWLYVYATVTVLTLFFLGFARRLSQMKRFFNVSLIIFKYFWIYLLIRLNLYKKPRQKLVKNFFEEAGGSFVKFGQILSLRVDALPREYSVELLDLLDNVKQFKSLSSISSSHYNCQNIC